MVEHWNIFVVRQPESKEVHAHAWVEVGEGFKLVFDPSVGRPEVVMASLPEYYEAGGIDGDQVRRYTPAQIGRRLIETEIYGPWDLPEENPVA